MQEIVKEFIELVKIPVHSRDERAIADVLKAKLTDLGLVVSEDNVGQEFGGNAGNIVAVLRGQSDLEPLIFSAHMDRVANNGCINPQIDTKRGLITSDGQSILAADNVAGLCVILAALRSIKAAGKPHGDIEVVLSACEEDGVLGSKYLDYKSIQAKMALVFDISGRVGRVVNQAPSKCKLQYIVHGKSAHAGNEPEIGINALKAAAALIGMLPDGRISPGTTANIAAIKGGGATTNIVCDYVEILAEARSNNAAEFDELLQRFSLAPQVIEQEFGVKIDYTEDIFYRSFHVSEKEPLLCLLKEAMQAEGVLCEITSGGGGMDGNRFNARGIKAVGVAPGYKKNHTPNELVYIEDLQKCTDIAVRFVELLAAKD